MSTGETDRFVSPAAPVTPAVAELVTILGEECAEVIVRASKLLRFGPEEVQPGHFHTNAQRLGHEIGDLFEMVDRLVLAGLITPASVQHGRDSKRKNLAKYLQHQEPKP